MEWLVYILECNDHTYYTGTTNNLKRRIEKHNAGIASKYTRGRLPVKVVFSQETENRSLACKLESAIKKLPRRQKEIIIGIG